MPPPRGDKRTPVGPPTRDDIEDEESEIGSGSAVSVANSGGPRAPWKCGSFPQLHPHLQDHVLAQGSRFGPAKWVNLAAPIPGLKERTTLDGRKAVPLLTTLQKSASSPAVGSSSSPASTLNRSRRSFKLTTSMTPKKLSRMTTSGHGDGTCTFASSPLSPRGGVPDRAGNNSCTALMGTLPPVLSYSFPPTPAFVRDHVRRKVYGIGPAYLSQMEPSEEFKERMVQERRGSCATDTGDGEIDDWNEQELWASSSLNDPERLHWSRSAGSLDVFLTEGFAHEERGEAPIPGRRGVRKTLGPMKNVRSHKCLEKVVFRGAVDVKNQSGVVWCK